MGCFQRGVSILAFFFVNNNVEREREREREGEVDKEMWKKKTVWVIVILRESKVFGIVDDALSVWPIENSSVDFWDVLVEKKIPVLESIWIFSK